MLTAAAETPPMTSGGSGTVDATFDTVTKALTWTITHKGLSGEVKAAHFHGPAAVGVKAPPVVPIVGSLASPIKGSAVLTEAQAKDLQKGLWYFNLHTAKYSGWGTSWPANVVDRVSRDSSYCNRARRHCAGRDHKGTISRHFCCRPGTFPRAS